MSLFEDPPPAYEPLASRMRPANRSEFCGQEHVLGEGKPLRAAIEAGQLHSMILWGPPGVGKTTLARMIAALGDIHFQSISAVLSGVADIRAAVKEAQQMRAAGGRKTLLFVDEVHRFNKSQQDAFLPFVEDGTIVLVGATTENPSFELNSALLSRARVYKLRSLEPGAIAGLLRRALQDPRGLSDRSLEVDDETLLALAQAADGDGRRALNLLEIAADLAGDGHIDEDVLAELLTSDHRRFDKGGDVFYEQISALHKAVRGSDPDAAIYWWLRMLDGGCEPHYVCRRLVRMASEDIGNADPRALRIALDAWDAFDRLGSPEGELAISQAVLFLASAAKSNAAYTAHGAALEDVRSGASDDVPVHLRNAATSLLEERGYGAEYQYAHDFPDAFVPGESYFPEALDGRRYSEPVARGLETLIGEKLSQLRALNERAAVRRYPADGTKGLKA